MHTSHEQTNTRARAAPVCNSHGGPCPASAHAKCPHYLYEYNLSAEQLRYARSLYRPSPSTATTFNVTAGGPPYAAKRVSWRAAVTATSIADVASACVPNTGDELLAFPQTVVDSNPNPKHNFGY